MNFSSKTGSFWMKLGKNESFVNESFDLIEYKSYTINALCLSFFIF
jgi:hypothetical protein